MFPAVLVKSGSISRVSACRLTTQVTSTITVEASMHECTLTYSRTKEKLILGSFIVSLPVMSLCAQPLFTTARHGTLATHSTTCGSDSLILFRRFSVNCDSTIDRRVHNTVHLWSRGGAEEKCVC